MDATGSNPPQQPDDEEAPRAQQPRPIPDEPGPHDVPDNEVIDKTLPTGGGDKPRD
ncbi:hypothetical protein [Ramlibacter humi]|uniref:hypothetical protein n=1 Tax=Ramlibacter humi TaxID=2530451 RepID=UPI00142F61B2|nr:hypothetical protein [Ramlibacter humi]